jgi:Family of unknown function (DUF5723)
MQKKVVVLLCTIGLCVLPGARLLAQQLLGIRNSNYAGIQGALLNPSSIADSKLKYDINILSVDEVFANNFLYAPKSNLSFFGIKKIIDGAIHETIFSTRYDPQNPNKLYNVSFSTEFLGPSFFVKIKKKHVVGFTMAARAYGNIKDITGNAAQNAYAYLLEPNLWNTGLQDHSARLNAMGWLQYGLHYATTIYSDGMNELNAGVSLNYLQGLGAAYVKNTNLNYQIQDTTHILFNNSSVDYGRTDIGDFKNHHDLTHGHGLGADIGFTYIHFSDPAKNNYVYRMGVSLIDIGAIKFTKNTGSYHLQATAADFANWHQSKFTGNNQLDQTLSAVFYNGDSSKSKTGNDFHMAMPTALSVQFDWNVCEAFFANATIVKGFGHGNNVGVVRPDVYSLTPRYETKWWEVSVPLSLLYYNHWQPRVGLAVRAGYFFIGGDAPGALLKLNDLNGVDFYAGIHYFVPEKSKTGRTSVQ